MPVISSRGRRRRVVLEEAVQGELRNESDDSRESGDSPPETGRTPVYSERARRRFQLRTTDLIPKRAFSVVAVISILLSALLGIVLIDHYAAHWEPVIGERGVEAFTIGQPNSLATWFSALILILTSIGCLQIFALRQHRRDDYRGVYRWWLWMAVILLLASMNNVVGIVEIAMTALGHLVQSDGPFTVGWGWVLVQLSVLFVLIGRFGYEMRVSRGALVGCGIVLVTYCSAITLQASPGLAETASTANLTFGNLMLFAKIAVLSVVLVYSRYIYLDAHGLVKAKERKARPAKAKKKKAPKPAKTEKRDSNPTAQPNVKRDRNSSTSKDSSTARSGKSKKRANQNSKPAEEKAAARTPLKTPRTVSSKSDVDDAMHAEIESLQGKTLSKSERRRLRKLQRRQSQSKAA